jgi:hypothetical protein
VSCRQVANCIVRVEPTNSPRPLTKISFSCPPCDRLNCVSSRCQKRGATTLRSPAQSSGRHRAGRRASRNAGKTWECV